MRTLSFGVRHVGRRRAFAFPCLFCRPCFAARGRARPTLDCGVPASRKTLYCLCLLCLSLCLLWLGNHVLHGAFWTDCVGWGKLASNRSHTLHVEEIARFYAQAVFSLCSVRSMRLHAKDGFRGGLSQLALSMGRVRYDLMLNSVQLCFCIFGFINTVRCKSGDQINQTIPNRVLRTGSYTVHVYK